MSEEDLQIADKTGEVKGKGEKGKIYPSECKFQRIAMRDKKGFLRE